MGSTRPVRVSSGGAPPREVARLMVHQVDVGHPVPGGIDGVVRGLLRFGPVADVTAVVGVLARDEPGRAVGRWEQYDVGGRVVWFLPVTRVDASDQHRRIPHSVRLVAALARQRRSLPRTASIHAHRADTAWAVHKLFPRTALTYFVHTQEHGLTSGATDSFWRLAPGVHRALERSSVTAAAQVVVFNREYADRLARGSGAVMFSPNWYEPDLMGYAPEGAVPGRVVWLGRLEPPKDPTLALTVLDRLVARDTRRPWHLVVVGSGTLAATLEQRRGDLPPGVRDRITFTGALEPQDVAATLATGEVFLMTSVPGYEGHPRVLVEALASGMPSVVTEGSDTGGLVVDGENGFCVVRDPDALAAAVERAAGLPRENARRSVEDLSAPRVVARILGGDRADAR